MKKLILLLSVCLVFISCTQPESEPKEKYPAIPRSEWDSQNIAEINTNSFSPNGAVTYPRTSGTRGILGNFHLETQQFAGMVEYTQKDDFTINNKGYYLTSHWSYTKSKGYFETKESYKYKLTKYSNDYFIIELYDIETNALNRKMFYQVTDSALFLTNCLNVNGETVYP